LRVRPRDHCLGWTLDDPDDFLSAARIGINSWPKLPADEWTVWSSERKWTSLKSNTCLLKAHWYYVEDATP
jgi:hypothetical protein